PRARRAAPLPVGLAGRRGRGRAGRGRHGGAVHQRTAGFPWAPRRVAHPHPRRRGERRNGGCCMSIGVIEASRLGKRYGSTWALRECTLAIPAGHVAALVGPNGAGKTTLLNLATGLAEPSAGTVAVLGGSRAGAPAALDGIAFVAQDTPLYKNLSAADMLHLTANLNRYFDRPYALARLAELDIPPQRKAGRLSGGQQAQLALTLALARR